jgi:hypothetical protein
MRDHDMIEEAIQRRAIGNPRQHITVRADWPTRPPTIWWEIVPALLCVLVGALVWWFA